MSRVPLNADVYKKDSRYGRVISEKGGYSFVYCSSEDLDFIISNSSTFHAFNGLIQECERLGYNYLGSRGGRHFMLEKQVKNAKK